MTNETFIEMRAETTKSREAMCDAKSVSYTEGSDDRLYNFKALGKAIGLPPRQILAVYYGKHAMALNYWFATGGESSEGIESTIDDMQNYLDLARAMYRES